MGTFVLRLIAFDGIRSTADDLTIAVTRAADFDHDTDVDLNDFSLFQACMTGVDQGPMSPQCTEEDIDGDQDVDQADFGLFQRCLSGQNNPGDPNCAN